MTCDTLFGHYETGHTFVSHFEAGLARYASHDLAIMSQALCTLLVTHGLAIVFFAIHTLLFKWHLIGIMPCANSLKHNWCGQFQLAHAYRVGL